MPDVILNIRLFLLENTNDFMSHVFISYSRKDSVLASYITLILRNNGIEVFTDVSGIAGGSSWRLELGKALDKSSAVIVLISNHSVESDYVLYEATYAISQDKIVLPIVLEDVDLDKIPFPLKHIQWLFLKHPITDDSFEPIIEVIKSRQSQFIDNVEKPTQQELSQQKNEIEKEITKQERVFIAYSRKQKNIAELLSKFLYEKNIPNFWDVKIKAGAVWRQTIQKALDDATHLIVLWTEDAASSDEVEREVSYALSERKVIIPILSQNIPKLPYHLHGLHYVVMEDKLDGIKSKIIEAIENYSDDIELWQ